MKNFQYFLIGLLTVLLGACATAPQPMEKRIALGMDKDEVLKVAGNPSRSARVSGADRWSYDHYENGTKKTTHVYFQANRVQFVGDDQEFELRLQEKLPAKVKNKESEGFRELK